MKNLLFVILCVLIAAVITGCGETEDPVTADLTDNTAAVGIVGAMKMPIEAAPAVPSAPTDGTPYVKSVGYYSDWKLTEEIDSETPVSVGTTIYTHIVFSEPMQLRVTDNEDGRGSRPVLYCWVNGGTDRFRMMPHGSQGEDFVSGDAKPKGGGTDDFVCKYRVEAEDDGSQFWIRVGQWSADMEWNRMNEAYVHKPRLRLGEPEEEPAEEEKSEPTAEVPTEESPEPTVVEEPKEEPVTPVPEEVTPLTVVSITHYRDRESTLIPEGTSVEHNTTVRTNIVFAEPIDPTSVVITYTTGGETKRFSYSTGGVHWRGLFQVNGNKKRIFCKQLAREDSFVVTLQEAKGLSGSTLTESVVSPTIPVGTHAVVPLPLPESSLPTKAVPLPLPESSSPIPPTPVPMAPQGADYSFETFEVDGETYPGFNPSSKLQDVLDTHPAAKLPHFMEAVRMTEVLDWAYRKDASLWQAGREQEGREIWRKARAHLDILDVHKSALLIIYFAAWEEDGEGLSGSAYWMFVEFLRLKLQCPDKSNREISHLFGESKNNVVGIYNPND